MRNWKIAAAELFLFLEISTGGSLIAHPIRALISAAVLAATPALAEQPVSGQLGEGKPNDIHLEMTRDADGGVAISQSEFRLAMAATTGSTWSARRRSRPRPAFISSPRS